ncbi:CWC15-like protein [Striga asiatica]|uniref:CWC15-like protein n=1 Tax=Striga asiatica TaxID=4170 RepID=A0A5A7REE7_STRAF|nr:CWC15-like protein [Striga asiatica]
MTTAARPTWAPAKGGNEQGGTRIFGPSQKYSSRDIASHTTLKPRKEGQDTQDELQKRNLRDELEDRERRHFSSKEDRERRKGGHLLLEGPRREVEDRIVPRSVDADDADVDAQTDDSDDDEDDDGDDEEALLAELERLRKEKAEQKEREPTAKLKKTPYGSAPVHVWLRYVSVQLSCKTKQAYDAYLSGKGKKRSSKLRKNNCCLEIPF